jgi:hypothetical protein
MTRRKKRNPAAFDRLTDALVEDILEASDADLLAEVQAEGGDDVDAARAAFNRASRSVALRELSGARAAGRARRRRPTNIRALDPKTARGWLDKFMAGNPETAGELSAAQSGEQLSDEDVYGMLEALQERGVLGQQGIEHGRR